MVDQPERDSNYINPFNGLAHRYYSSLRDWYGYVRFLGSGLLVDSPDIPLDKLFVEPSFTIYGGRSETGRPGAYRWRLRMTDALKHNRLLLFGDPGTGKSTVVQWLVNEFTRRDPGFGLSVHGQLFPLPVILRELPKLEDGTKEALIGAFLKTPWGSLLSNPDGSGSLHPEVESVLTSGQALWMLDGVDEVLEPGQAAFLREAVIDGMSSWENSHWVITSRIVGFESFPHEVTEQDEVLVEASRETAKVGPRSANKRSTAGNSDGAQTVPDEPSEQGKRLDVPEITRLYTEPLSEQQMKQFAQNFFVLREPAVAKRVTAEFLYAIRLHRGLSALGRVPNLLSMMALIFMNEGRLPDGRSHLYDRILDAYLEGISIARKLPPPPYSLQTMRRGLSKIAFEMMLSSMHGDVTRQQVAEWLLEEGIQPDQFLKYLGARTGILLPRGQDVYAWVHQSFVDYGAALYLDSCLGFAGKLPDEVSLPKLARHQGWQEALVFLFELQSSPSQVEALARLCELDEKESMPPLVARLGWNTHVAARDGLAMLWCEESTRVRPKGDIRVWEFARSRASVIPERSHRIRELQLAGFHIRLRDLPHLFPSLSTLDLREVRVTNLEALAALPDLKELNLEKTSVANLEPLQRLKTLERLSLADTKVDDVSPLAGLKALKQLDLQNTSIKAFPKFAAGNVLESLNLSCTVLTNVESLSELKALKALDLTRTFVSDISPLAGLTRLETLSVANTGVKDLVALRHSKELRFLNVMFTQVSDLSPLKDLPHLTELRVALSKVRSLKSLHHRKDLQVRIYVSDLKD